MPARPSASMSYLMFWPTFSIIGSAKMGRSASRVVDGSSTLDPAGPRSGR